MAGKISLYMIVSALLVLSGYMICKAERRLNMLPFRVAQVVLEGDQQETIRGMQPPYTVLVHSGAYVQQTLPGQLGNLGDEIYLPDPRYSSGSTKLP